MMRSRCTDGRCSGTGMRWSARPEQHVDHPGRSHDDQQHLPAREGVRAGEVGEPDQRTGAGAKPDARDCESRGPRLRLPPILFRAPARRFLDRTGPRARGTPGVSRGARSRESAGVAGPCELRPVRRGRRPVQRPRGQVGRQARRRRTVPSRTASPISPWKACESPSTGASSATRVTSPTTPPSRPSGAGPTSASCWRKLRSEGPVRKEGTKADAKPGPGETPFTRSVADAGKTGPETTSTTAARDPALQARTTSPLGITAWGSS